MSETIAAPARMEGHVLGAKPLNVLHWNLLSIDVNFIDVPCRQNSSHSHTTESVQNVKKYTLLCERM